ncbi:hypothetical protein [Lacibacter luteus]|nr:hypothetical protein [Lacibacter luteus]
MGDQQNKHDHTESNEKKKTYPASGQIEIEQEKQNEKRRQKMQE